LGYLYITYDILNILRVKSLNIRVKNGFYVKISNMKKLIVSLTEETNELLRKYVKEVYNNRRGAISIVVEAVILEFFRRNTIDDSSRSGFRSFFKCFAC